MAVILGSLTSGVDNFTGSAADDIVIVPSNNANLAGTDIIDLGGGIDTLRFDRTLELGVASSRLDGISGVDVFDIRAPSSVLFSISDAVLLQSDAARITLLFAASPVMLDLRSLTAEAGRVVLAGHGQVTLMDAARQSVEIADGVNGNVMGGALRDALTGGTGNDRLNGLAGDDVLVGGAGADSLTGGDGQDRLDGAAGNDTLDGGAGFDLLTGGSGTNLVTGGAGSDVFVVTAGETLILSDFAVTDRYERIDLRALGTAGFDQLVITTQGADTLINPGFGTVIRLQGVTTALHADHFVFAGDTRVLRAAALGVVPDFVFTASVDNFAGTAADEVFELSGSSVNLAATDVFSGGAGTDTLRLVGADRSISAARLAGMSGVEVLDFTAATGVSTLSLDASVTSQAEGGVLTIRQGAGPLSLDTGVTVPSLAEAGKIIVEGTGAVTLRATTAQALTISDLYGGHVTGGSRADMVVGGARDDSVFGGAGDDTLSGGAGNDSLSGGDGMDMLQGGAGINTLTGGLGADQFVVALASQTTITDFDEADTTERVDLRAFAGLVFAGLQMQAEGSGTRIILPDGSVLRIAGILPQDLRPNDFIFAGQDTPQTFTLTMGTDRFTGGTGDDVFAFGGNTTNLDVTDRLNGGAGTDTLRVSGADRSLSAARLASLTAIEVIDLAATTGTNTVEITQALVSTSGTGNILVRHGSAALSLDTSLVTDLGDVITEGAGLVSLRNQPGQKLLISDAVAGHVQGGNDGDLVRGGANNDRINGGEGNDTVSGGNGNDTLTGGDGQDHLTGGAGLDTLYGGAGDDTLVADFLHDVVDGGLGNDLHVVLRTAGVTTIAGFEADNLLERIDLTDFAELTGMANLTLTQTGAHVTVTAADLNLVVQNTSVADIGADDFVFSGQDALVFHVDASMALADIQHLLNEAPAGATVLFAAGTYSITQTLVINRSDISVIGAGEGQTILRTDIPGGQPAPTILVQPEDFQTRLGVLAENAAQGTSQVTLQSGHGLAVGDILYVSQANDDAWLAETGNTGWVPPDNAPRDGEDYYLREARSRIVAIDGDTVTLAEPLPYAFAANLATAARSTFLSNVTLQGFTVQGVWGEADPFVFEVTLPEWEGMSTIEIDGVTNSTIQNISVLDAASHAFRLQRLYDVTGDHLTVNGAHNKDGGNGYSFLLYESFANALTNLTSIDARHAVLFSSYSAEHYNLIHVLFSNRDINFHGSPDAGNTVIVDRLVQDYPAGSAPQFDAVQGGSFPLHPNWTIDANDVTFRHAVTGERDDRIFAHAEGGNLSTGKGNDQLFGGAGNDTLDGGENGDVMKGGAGRDTFIRQYADFSDTILDFAAGAGGDVVLIQGSAYTTFAQLRLSQSGADTVLSFGLGGAIRFSNTQASGFTAANFAFARDTAAGQTQTLRADDLFAVGTDRADVFNITGFQTGNAAFRVLGGMGTDTVAMAQQSLSGNLFTTGSYAGIDRFDISRVSFAVITVDNRLAAQSDTQSLILAVGDSGAPVSLDLQPLGAGRSLFVDGSRDVRLTGGILHTISATDRAGVNILGDTATDVMTGGARNDVLNGADGRDLLAGGLGQDTLIGGLGIDTLYGGYGSDTFYVDTIGDIVGENRRWDGVDLVISSVDFLMGRQHIENLTLTGTGAIRGIGNGLENVVTGNSGDNLIDGGPRNDLMTGGLGNDIYLVRDAGDLVIEGAGGGIDSVRSFISYELSAEVENLYIQTNVALNGRGNALNNTIVGNNVANVINGREGSDVLTGQGGADTFVFDRAASAQNADRIMDFQGDADRFLFARSAFEGFAAGPFQADALIYGTAAAQAEDRLIYDRTTGRLWYDADGTGSGEQQLVAVLANRATLDAGDIFLA